ncbi:endoribonuclease LACTB2 [Athalia rosae]|uniref:endoribonuclease LACTB2 n=1 Tax=Athalia rosae TaxID=37344 RepID=UPI00203329A5|nr:endoribonuclease LACTB2 [Athalia rosae]
MTNSLTAIPLVSRISSRVIRVLGCNPGPMTLQGTNTYLVGTGKRRILIDSGDKETAPEYTRLLSDVLKSEDATLEHLLLTHWHHDHVGGAKSVRNLLTSHKRSPDENSLRIWKLPRSPGDATTLTEEERDLGDFEALEDGQNFEVEGATLKVRRTPGHTTDHACLQLEEDNALFSGDCILGEGTAVFEDLRDYMKSLDEIADMAPAVIYPGHGPVVDDPLPKVKFYIEHRRRREEEILEAVRKNADLQGNAGLSEIDIVRRVYKNTPENLWPAAAENVGHHLKKLSKEGKICGEKGGWFARRN